MPIYEYHCNDCGKDFERLVLGPSGQDEVLCPACRKTDVVKKFSVFAAATGSSRESAGPPPGGCGVCDVSCPNRR
jgi:putative FmdB family regulatory protein